MDSTSPVNAHRSLRAALMLVRQFVPIATTVDLHTGDSALEGFRLTEVTLNDGHLLSAVDPGLLDNLNDDIWRHLRHLPWDDLVGEDAYGRAHLTLPDGPIPAKTVWCCLTCGFSSTELRADRDSEHLRHDGAHHPVWYPDDDIGD